MLAAVFKHLFLRHQDTAKRPGTIWYQRKWRRF